MDEKKVESKPAPKGLNTPKEPQDIKKLISAEELLAQFMKKQGIALYLGDLKIKTVSDGSIIIEKPAIRAKYNG